MSSSIATGETTFGEGFQALKKASSAGSGASLRAFSRCQVSVVSVMLDIGKKTLCPEVVVEKKEGCGS